MLSSCIVWRLAQKRSAIPSNSCLDLSSNLPYCDAMFVDDECAQLLSEGRLAAAVSDYATRIFSTRTRDDFLAYLDAVEAEADPAHVDLVIRTYGEKWLQPYRSVLEHERGG